MTHPLSNLIRRISAIALTALVIASGAAACSLADEDEEVKLGRENAIENDKVIKLVTDPTITDRVNRIGQEIAKVANEIEVPAIWGTAVVKKFAYTFKVVDEKDINAYSLPGGFIYINKGTLEFSQSDDEIAGVLAHEVAHASHHHMMKLIKEQNKIQNAMLIPMLIAILGGGGEGAATALQVGQLYTVAKMNSFGVEAEQDADQAAVHYMQRTSYNPVGVLTFMERLARKERFQPQVELGIYRTHPPTPERAESLVKELADAGIEVNRRETDPSLGARSGPAPMGGKAYAEVRLGTTLLARVGDLAPDTADIRGQKLSQTINKLLDSGLKLFEIKMSLDGSRVVARGRTLVLYGPGDVEGTGQTVQQAARATYEALRNIVWQDQFNRTETGG
ncbi:MAG: M48 family metalloprotease [Armatimonadetes bacterium]|nr:M48 family metalloprotease [Armatimonadota bacterium]